MKLIDHLVRGYFAALAFAGPLACVAVAVGEGSVKPAS
jgi:hypothetical protein